MHIHDKWEIEDLEGSLIRCETRESSEETEAPKSLIKNWPLMSAIIVYCVFSLQDMAYSEVLSYLNTSSVYVLEGYYTCMMHGLTYVIPIKHDIV